MTSELQDNPTLLKRATELFTIRFERQPSVAVCSPGRVNLIGDHVDYNGGYVLPMALPMATVIVGDFNGLKTCRVETDPDCQETDDPKYIEFNIPTASSPLEPSIPKWANYVKGVISFFHAAPVQQGFDVVIVSSVPLGAGLSSSAALEVGFYTFLEQLLNNPAPSLKEKALACQNAEHVFAKCPCGIMDQFVCSHAIAGCALLLDCKLLEARNVPLNDDKICVLVIDSGVKHELSGSEYPLRRSQCEKAAKILGAECLRDVSRTYLEGRKRELELDIYRRALHVVNETEYTLDFVNFLENREYEKAGECMLKSHASLRDLYDVSCKEIDAIVDISSNTGGIYGARMTGGGFGGCVVALAEKDQVRAAIDSIGNACRSNGLSPKFYVCEPCGGTRALP